ncbi:MAG: ATP-dependent DNA ligase [Pirellulales bacterium]
MQLFARLFTDLDTTTRTVEKVQALERYFAAAPSRDAVWALYFLTGRRIKRAVNTRLLRDWLSAETGLPLWIIDESYDAGGDLAETLALLLPDHSADSTAASTDRTITAPGMLFSQEEMLEGYAGLQQAAEADQSADVSMPLHRLVEERIVPLTDLPVEAQRILVTRTWHQLDAAERFLWHKLIMGEFRVGVAHTLVARALANVAGVPPETMAHRLMGDWTPTAEDYQRLLSPSSWASDPGQPYPFFLAHPLAGDPQELGEVDEWQAEWKWDGIRAQLLRREDQVVLWSRGEDLLTDRFPEIAAVGAALPNGVVVDGEILAWRDERPLPFAALQTRIGRKNLSAAVLAAAPAMFMAYDLLELEGTDLRASTLIERRAKLEVLAAHLPAGLAVRLSPLVELPSWEALVELRRTARDRGVEGIMLKRRSSAYGVGRPKGEWWKWKVDPLTIDAVLIYAQPGHGRRASLYTDYTFGVWHEGELVPVAKAYSGLTDAEIRQVDAFIRRNTLARHGPVRIVRPELVFELHFEAIQPSTRHRSGVAVRFPRMNHWRQDKKPEEADTLATLRALAASLERGK